jgi:hypothetical protein
MPLRQKLFSFIFLRNMLTDFGDRSPYSAKTKNFPPYFLYRIGIYHSDYYLYFRKQPYLQRYKNEIFNKMYEYSGYDIIRYLEFHYDAYGNKTEFIRFLRYEASERLKRFRSKNYRLKLQSTLDWLSEKSDEQKALQEKNLKVQIEEDVRSTLDDLPSPNFNVDSLVQRLSDRFASRLDQVVSDTQEKMTSLTDSFPSGNIELNNHSNLEKVIQVYFLILSIKAPGEAGSEDKLFKRFSATDLASILQIHFQAFKDKKFNTVQGKITEYTDRLRINNPKVQNLNRALEAFFY